MFSGLRRTFDLGSTDLVDGVEVDGGDGNDGCDSVVMVTSAAAVSSMIWSRCACAISIKSLDTLNLFA